MRGCVLAICFGPVKLKLEGVGEPSSVFDITIRRASFPYQYGFPYLRHLGSVFIKS